MSDFLTRLVERSRDVQLTTQPRIPSFYAPEPVSATDSNSTASAPRLEPSDPPQLVELDSSNIQTALRRNEDVSASVVASGNALGEVQARAHPPRHEVVPESPTSNRPPTASLPTKNEQQSIESKTALEPLAEPVTAVERRAPDFSVSGKATPHAKVSPTLLTIRPRLQVPSHQAEPPLTEQRSSPAAPTIRVTIGRVEVRAVMPAQPAPRPARHKPSPSLSLEDYLKQRDGRRR